MIIERKVVLEMAHRLPKHQGKCRNIHGHSWQLSVAVTGPINHSGTSEDGMVVDFNLLKSALMMVENVFDHTLTLADYDPLHLRLIDSTRSLIDSARSSKSYPWGEHIETAFGAINVLRGLAPTSENLTLIWKDMLRESMPGITVCQVSVKETACSEAIWMAE